MKNQKKKKKHLPNRDCCLKKTEFSFSFFFSFETIKNMSCDIERNFLLFSLLLNDKQKNEKNISGGKNEFISIKLKKAKKKSQSQSKNGPTKEKKYIRKKIKRKVLLR